MNEDLFQQLQTVLCAELHVTPEKLTADCALIEDLGADSLDLIRLAMEVEERFQIEINERDLANFKTVGDVLNHLRTHVRAA